MGEVIDLLVNNKRSYTSKQLSKIFGVTTVTINHNLLRIRRLDNLGNGYVLRMKEISHHGEVAYWAEIPNEEN